MHERMPDLLFAPRPEIADCVRHGSVLTLPGGPYLLPAGLHPLFVVVLDGEVSSHDEGGHAVRLPMLGLCGGTRSMRRASAAPGTRLLTMSLRAGCLPRLLGLSALEVMDGRVDLADVLRGEAHAALARCRARLHASRVPAAQVEAFQALLCDLRRIRPGAADVLSLPPDWLGRPAAELAAHCGLGLRQFERRFLACHGRSLRSFRQQARCSRLVKALADGGAAVRWAELADAAGYHDQSHLGHDLLRFTGHAPGQLLAGIRRGDPAFWPYRVPEPILTRLFGATGY